MSAPSKVLRPNPAILEPIDAMLKERLPAWQTCEGVAYWRWAYINEIVSDAQLGALIAGTCPAGHFRGVVCSKPVTALFFYPVFE